MALDSIQVIPKYQQIHKFIKICRGLKFNEEPPYQELRNIIENYAEPIKERIILLMKVSAKSINGLVMNYYAQKFIKNKLIELKITKSM